MYFLRHNLFLLVLPLSTKPVHYSWMVTVLPNPALSDLTGSSAAQARVHLLLTLSKKGAPLYEGKEALILTLLKNVSVIYSTIYTDRKRLRKQQGVELKIIHIDVVSP